MTNKEEQLESLKDIRNLMERSSRFTSLSGFSGVFIGLFALAAIGVLYMRFELVDENDYYPDIHTDEDLWFLVQLSVTTLLLSLSTGIGFTMYRARKMKLRMWDQTARRTATNLAIPLVTGGFFCVALLLRGETSLLAAITLIFYGLALVNASKFTLNEIRSLGLLDCVLGIFALFFPGYALFAWAIGFGLLHIVYGIYMYSKYER